MLGHPFEPDRARDGESDSDISMEELRALLRDQQERTGQLEAEAALMRGHLEQQRRERDSLVGAVAHLTRQEPKVPGVSRAGWLKSLAAAVAGLVGVGLLKGESPDVAEAYSQPNFIANGPSTSGFSTNGSFVYGVQAYGTSFGLWGDSTSVNGTGVFGMSQGSGVSSVGVTGTGVVGVSGSTSTSNSSGVRGQDTSSSSGGAGVLGSSTHGIGVSGLGPTGVNGTSSSGTGTGVSGSGAPGVAGTSTTGTGVIGSGMVGVSGSGSTGSGVVGASTGEHGIKGTTSAAQFGGVLGVAAAASSAGVLGTDGNQPGAVAGFFSGALVASNTSGHGVTGFTSSARAGGVIGVASAANTAGVIGSDGGNGASGALAAYFSGTVVTTGGGKSAAVPYPDKSHRLLYAVEAPECWFEDFGEAHLKNGQAKVQIPADFAPVVDTDQQYFVFLTDHNAAGHGLSVTERQPGYFKVQERQPGTSNGSFSFRLVARRKDVQPQRLARVALPDIAKAHPDINYNTVPEVDLEKHGG